MFNLKHNKSSNAFNTSEPNFGVKKQSLHMHFLQVGPHDNISKFLCQTANPPSLLRCYDRGEISFFKARNNRSRSKNCCISWWVLFSLVQCFTRKEGLYVVHIETAGTYIQAVKPNDGVPGDENHVTISRDHHP